MRRLLRSLWIFLFGFVLGTGVGLVAGLIVFPYVFAPPPAAEQTSETDTKIRARGTFVHVNPSDPVHWGKGQATLYEGAVFLEADFEVAPGPAYHVYLVSGRDIRSNDKAAFGEALDLGRLRAFRGSQRYALPAGTDTTKYATVVVWCETFGVLISPASLMPVTNL